MRTPTTIPTHLRTVPVRTAKTAADGPEEGALVDIEQALSGDDWGETTRIDRPKSAPADAVYRPRLFVVPGIGEGAPGRRSRARTPYGRTAGSRPGSRTRAPDRHAVRGGAVPAGRAAVPVPAW